VHEFYQVLGVRSGAADDEIKVAFRSLAKQLHPDLHPGDRDAERRLQDVIRAYETLSDRQSRMAYDAGLKNQRSLRRWRLRANAMTVVAAFSLTVSLGFHWQILSEAILPTNERTARLAGSETYTAASGKAAGVSSSIRGKPPQAAEERGNAAALNKSAELNAEPSSALQSHSSANELAEELSLKPMTTGAPSLTLADLNLTHNPAHDMTAPQHSVPDKSPELKAELSSAIQDQSFTNELAELSAKPMTAEASSLKSLALADLALIPANETTAPQRSVSQAPNKAQSGSGAGWWIILGSVNVDEGDNASTLISRASGAARRCGMDAFNDLSSNFRGFAPGYMVVVIGPFADKVEAARSRQQVNGCVSRTYVKYAQHLGE
jgi:curved DNA-binding protein CbpA